MESACWMRGAAKVSEPQAGPAGRARHRRGFLSRDAEPRRGADGPELGIRYLHANCERLEGLASGSFDVVVSNMVLMDLPDHRAALKSFYRVLVERGRPGLFDLSSLFFRAGPRLG